MECQSAICQSDYSQKLITDLVIYPQGIVAGPNILTYFSSLFNQDILRLIVLQVLYYPTNPPDILTEFRDNATDNTAGKVQITASPTGSSWIITHELEK